MDYREKHLTVCFNNAQDYTVFQKSGIFFGIGTCSVSYTSPFSRPTPRSTSVLYISLPCCVALMFGNRSPILIDLWNLFISSLEMNRCHFHKVEGMLPVIRGNTRWFSSPSFYHCCVLCSLLLPDLSFTSSSYHPLTYCISLKYSPWPSGLSFWKLFCVCVQLPAFIR